MFKKILVPLSGSATSERALPLVKELLQGDAEQATLLAIFQSPAGTAGSRPSLQRRLPLQHIGAAFCDGSPNVTAGGCEELSLLNYLGQAGQPLIATGRAVCAAVAFGEPAKEIIDFAKAGRFDLIVMTTHIRGSLHETLDESVSAEVSRSGVAPVLALTPEHSTGSECPLVQSPRGGMPARVPA